MIAHAESDQPLDQLVMEHALPTIDSVLRRRCHGWSDLTTVRDDIRGEALVHLMRRLRSSNAGGVTIGSFKDYVAALTHRVVDDVIRDRFPRRTQLKNRIRYLLRHDSRFTYTSSGTATFCALAKTASAGKQRQHSSEVETLAEQVSTILRQQTRCALDDLVNAIAAANGLTEERTIDFETMADLIPAADQAVGRMEAMESLRWLWKEIVVLPVKQRAALLLNLQDMNGESLVALLPLLAITSIQEVAATLGISLEELLELWDKLPLADDQIGAILFLKRQQVINLRKSARDRLRRRMARAYGTWER